jgi:hypothetical protein
LEIDWFGDFNGALMLARRAGKFREMSRFVDEKQITGEVEKFSREFLCTEFELDLVVAQQARFEIALSEVERYLIRGTKDQTSAPGGRGEARRFVHISAA